MSVLGLLMFGVVLALMILTGLPVYAVLLSVASVFAVAGVLLGAFDAALLAVLPLRIIGLLEHDLLQALPLYAFIGALLNRLPLAALLLRSGERLFARSGGATQLSALCVGALLAPMNGSVGASLHTLSRSVVPALAARGVPAAEATATVCVASTLGVVVPPSLVLLLLGDAMMRAHTEAANAMHAAVRIVNSQDVMRAALVPGALVLVGALLLAAWRARGRATRATAPLAPSEVATALLAALLIGGLLAGVAVGRLYAVEAAATGAMLLLVYAAGTDRIDRAVLHRVLHDTMTLTGLLFALLVAATTFSMVLRGFGTDLLIGRTLGALANRPLALLGVVLAGLVACSFVLDAFEITFLVVPLVMPPVLTAVSDPAWVAALTLLVLQAGFLLPPFGFALLMARTLMGGAVGLAALARALLPQLALQAALIVAVLLLPQITRWTRPVATVATGSTAEDAARIERAMQDAIDAQSRGRQAQEALTDRASGTGH